MSRRFDRALGNNMSGIETNIVRDAQGLAIGVRFAFADAQGQLPELTILASDLAAHVAAEALCHGIKQKVGDAAAIGRDAATGKSASVGDKRVAMCEVAKQIREGAWNRKAGKGEGMGGEGLFMLALAQVTNKSADECKTILATMTEGEQKALRRDPSIIRAMADIQATRARATTDTAGLLAKFAPPKIADAVFEQATKDAEAKAQAPVKARGKAKAG